MTGNGADTEKPCRLFPSMRFFMFMLLLVILTVMGGGFYAFNFSLVCMTNETAVTLPMTTSNGNSSSGRICDVRISELVESRGYDGEFFWDRGIQSHLIAAHAYGAVIANIPSGLLADRYGTKLVILVCLLCNAVANGLGPIAANAGAWWLFATRVIQGFGYGASWPAVFAMLPRWSAESETGTLLTIGTMGYQLGGLVAMVTASSICASIYRWPLIFYLWCALSVVSAVIWMIIYTDEPSKCRFISQNELEYLEKHKAHSSAKTESFWKVPWKYILFSPAAVATHLCQFAYTWTTYYTGEFMPTYSKEVLRFEVQGNGLASALPALMQVIPRFIYGPLGDKINFGGRSTTFSVKIFTFIGNILPCLCFVLLGFLDCRHVTLALVAFSILAACSSSCTVGYCRGGILMAPRYAGALGAISNTYGDTAAVIMPYIIGGIAKHGTTPEWQYTAWVTAVVLAISGTAYMLFGTAEEQSWATDTKTSAPGRKVHVLDVVELKNVRKLDVEGG